MSDTTIQSRTRNLVLGLLLALVALSSLVPAQAAEAPLVMLALSRDENWFHEAYPESLDTDSDGVMDGGYVDNATYTGYFHPQRCYRYSDANQRFEPAGRTDASANRHYCLGALADAFSGNFLNWATMTRMDLMRRALYGGYRVVDTAVSTVLERANLPADAHSFAHYYNGADLAALTPFDTVKTDTTNGGNGDGFDNAGEGITLCNLTYDFDNTVFPNYSQNTIAKPLLRIVAGAYRLWDSSERWQCTWQSERGNISNSNVSSASGLDTSTGYPPDTARLLTTAGSADRVVRVTACDPAWFDDADNAEACRLYPAGNRKPSGVLQRYGETGLEKFGLITGSWNKNLSGGALRKNIGSLADEINLATDGSFKPAPVTGSIIRTLDTFRVFGYGYTTGEYRPQPGGSSPPENCTYMLAAITEGSCRAWGNPLSEIYLEALRYFALSSGRGPTAAFNPDDTTSFPAMLDQPWTVDPLAGLAGIPSLNVVVLNGAAPSYDDNATSSPLLGGATPQALTNAVGAGENLNGQSLLVGRVGASGDEFCSLKVVTGLGDAYGPCPSAPTTNGSYHIAGLAHYAHTHDLRPDLQGGQSLNTYGVEVANNEPVIEIPIGPAGAALRVRLTPAYRLVSNATGGSLAKLKVVRRHAEVDPSDRSSPGGGPNSIPDGQPDIGSNGVPSVNFPQPLAGSGIFHGKFYLNWDDSEQGGDYDQDSWGTLDYVVNTNVTPATVTVTTKAVAQSTSGGQLFGFVIDGTTQDGFHAYSGVLGGNFFAVPGTDPSGVKGCSDCRALSETVNLGRIITVSVSGAGSGAGFTANQAVTLIGNTSGAATATGRAFITGTGKLNGIGSLNGGTGYTSGEQVTIRPTGIPGFATPATATITADPNTAQRGAQSHTFTVANSGGSHLLQTPLWYASKWGGFYDTNGNGVPDHAGEWDARDSNGVPDNYYGLRNLASFDAALEGVVARISLADFDGDGLPDTDDLDDDNDGLPDTWELSFQLNPFDAGDAGQDTDGDGRSNLVEFQQGTNPRIVESDFDQDGMIDARDPDDDNDGLSDRWELTYLLNPFDATDAAQDPDIDGRSNVVEYQQGSNPLVADTPPSLLKIVMNLLVSSHETAAGNDPGFVPFSTQVTLTFDFHRASLEGNMLSFAGQNQFDSPLTAGLPWLPAPGLPPEGNLAVLAQFETTGYVYWDDRYYSQDTAAQTQSRYGISIGGGPTESQYVSDLVNFQTPQLLEFLGDQQLAGTLFDFGEFASIFDSQAQQYTAYDAYTGVATIASITPIATASPNAKKVPLPGLALFALGGGLLALVKRRR